LRDGKWDINAEARGWAIIDYSRAQAFAEKADLPVNLGALDK